MTLDLSQYATVNQTQAHESRSDRYNFVSTIEQVNTFKAHGWEPVSIQETKSRSVSNRGFQKHMIKFRQSDQMELKTVGDEILELILKAAHDGSGTFELLLGLFRLACSNGAVAMIGDFGSFRILHKGLTEEKVSQAILHVLDYGPQLLERVQEFKSIPLTDSMQNHFASKAIELVNDGEKFTLKTADLLAARRIEDKSNDLWTTFNRVQENVIRGGITRTTLNGRSRRTREVKNIDRNVKLNQGLWKIADTIAIEYMN